MGEWYGRAFRQEPERLEEQLGSHGAAKEARM